MVVHYQQGKLPPTELVWPKLLPLIGPANAAIAHYDGVLDGIPKLHAEPLLPVRREIADGK